MNGKKIARLVSFLAALAGALGAAWNTARLTVPDTAAGPVDFLLYAGIPALLAAAGAAGTAMVKPSGGKSDAPGSPGHAEFCDALYRLAVACDWDRATAQIAAWKATNPPPGGGGAV